MSDWGYLESLVKEDSALPCKEFVEKTYNFLATSTRDGKVLIENFPVTATGSDLREADCMATAIVMRKYWGRVELALIPETTEMSVRQAAEKLSVSISTIYRRIKSGKLTASKTKLNGRSIMVIAL